MPKPNRTGATPCVSHPARYYLITYMRIEPEKPEPMTHAQALAEKDQQELMFPEHIHRIEEIPHP